MRTFLSRSVPVCVAIAAALALAGCTSSPPVSAPTPPAASRTADPVETPEPVEPKLERIVISAEVIQFVNDDGSIEFETGYFTAADGIIAQLEEVAREAPEHSVREAIEREQWDNYEWSAITVFDNKGEGAEPYQPGFNVVVTEATIGGVSIETPDGYSVGDSATAIESAHPDESERGGPTGKPESLSVYLNSVDLPASDDVGIGANPAFRVYLGATDPEGEIDRIIAPSPNFGP